MKNNIKTVWTVGNEAVILSKHATREQALAAWNELSDEDKQVFSIQESSTAWLQFLENRGY